ncbi:hypothetical protein DR980_06130 [Flavobacterium psychrolimnae]|uniref:Uncharacterized protein n=1 Tax=Flavobacterium psychrolimnae TaxID=249351 RepID=A0A366B414_9FLAO|nr:hypothetical protein DR980_06130 [Flavobacterium psychrolimnae]
MTFDFAQAAIKLDFKSTKTFELLISSRFLNLLHYICIEILTVSECSSYMLGICLYLYIKYVFVFLHNFNINLYNSHFYIFYFTII